MRTQHETKIIHFGAIGRAHNLAGNHRDSNGVWLSNLARTGSSNRYSRLGNSGATSRGNAGLNQDNGMNGHAEVINQPDTLSAIWMTLVGIMNVISPFIAFVIASSVIIALFPPKSKMHVFGLLACCAGSFFYFGALVIDVYGLQSYSQNAKDGIRFACAVPMWMSLQILAVALTKWRDAKDPISKITNDLKKIIKIWKGA